MREVTEAAELEGSPLRAAGELLVRSYRAPVLTSELIQAAGPNAERWARVLEDRGLAEWRKVASGRAVRLTLRGLAELGQRLVPTRLEDLGELNGLPIEILEALHTEGEIPLGVLRGRLRGARFSGGAVRTVARHGLIGVRGGDPLLHVSRSQRGQELLELRRRPRTSRPRGES